MTFILAMNRNIAKISIPVFVAALWMSTINNAQQRNVYDPFESRNDYRAKLHVLRGLVHRYGRTRVNRIYVAKTDSGDGKMFLYGYWPADHSIWLVGHLDPWFENGREATDYAWLKYKMRTDLRTDVVPTVEDIGGSSYLVDRPWTRRIIKACVTRGRKIVINRTAQTRRRLASHAQQLVGPARG